VVLLGPPGAGKGTHASRVAGKLSVPKMASGDLFREHQKNNTSLGRLAQSYMERGVLVPDEITINMVMDWIGENGNDRGFLLDGFPRTLTQASALAESLSVDSGIDRVIYIDVPTAVLIRRLSGRQICRCCQSIYHLEFAPLQSGGECDNCGGEIYQREDDRKESVLCRLEVYKAETEPLIEYYRNLEILVDVDGNKDVEDVEGVLMKAVGS
jgi:adenylate kinase